HLYLATDLRPADGERLGPDEDEHLLLEKMPWRDAVAAAERGELRDGKTIAALLWLARLQGGEGGGL
ncbi:MAG: ADP-ribose pyrophosphatase, partial [Chloroflexota bacterium]